MKSINRLIVVVVVNCYIHAHTYLLTHAQINKEDNNVVHEITQSRKESG